MRVYDTLSFVCAALLIVIMAGSVSADIFVRIHEDGHKEFTNSPSGPGWVYYASEKGFQPVIKFKVKAKPKSVDELILEISKKFKVSPALVKAIATAESNCDPKAISRKGAQGVMQLMPRTARELNVTAPLDPRDNIVGGVKYIKGLIASHGDLRLALAAYNAGPAAVKRYAGIPPYRETINYVKKVIRYYRVYNKMDEYKLAGR